MLVSRKEGKRSRALLRACKLILELLLLSYAELQRLDIVLSSDPLS